jgi:hypothetical protein
MDTFDIPDKKYTVGKKKSKTFRWPVKLLERLTEEAELKGRTNPQEVAFEILDMYFIQRDKKQKIAEPK